MRGREKRLTILQSKESAEQMVAKAVATRIGTFKKQEIVEVCPSLGVSTIERALKRLCEQKAIAKKGTGRSTFYVIL